MWDIKDLLFKFRKLVVRSVERTSESHLYKTSKPLVQRKYCAVNHEVLNDKKTAFFLSCMNLNFLEHMFVLGDTKMVSKQARVVINLS